MTPEDEEFQRISREIKRRSEEDDDIQEYKKPWVGLTDKELEKIYETHHNQYGECETPKFGYERAIEQRLKEKNF
jgi:tRNA(Ile)-lysidine synthase TilS/MesJ